MLTLQVKKKMQMTMTLKHGLKAAFALPMEHFHHGAAPSDQAQEI